MEHRHPSKLLVDKAGGPVEEHRGAGASRRATAVKYTNASNDLGLILDLLPPTSTAAPTLEQNGFASPPLDGEDGSNPPLVQNGLDGIEDVIMEPVAGEGAAAAGGEDGDEGDQAAAEAADGAAVAEAADGAMAGAGNAADAEATEGETASTASDEVEADTTAATSYSCTNNANNANSNGNGSATATTTKRIKQPISYDYDVLLSTPTAQLNDAAGNINEAIQTIEMRLLEYVGSELEGLGLCGTQGEPMRRSLRRSLANESSHGEYALGEISSLPADEVLRDATCASQGTSGSNEGEAVGCHPVAGYMTAYYDVDDSVEDESSLEEMKAAIDDIIQRGMKEPGLLESIAAEESGISGVYFVGDRTNASVEGQQPVGLSPVGGIANPSNQLVEPNNESSSKPALIAGTVGGILAALLVLCLVICAKRRNKGGKGTNATAEYDSDEEEGELHQNESMRNNCERTNHIIAACDDTVGEETVDGYRVDNFPYNGQSVDDSRVGQWVSRSLTSMTDATPVVSNVTYSRRHPSSMGTSTIEEGDDEEGY